MTQPTSRLDAVFRARSIAIIGASTDPRRIGGRPLADTLRAGFTGPIYPVNPNADQVQGLKAYKSITDVPGPVDLVVIALPASKTLEAVQASIACRAGSVMLYGSGFGEVDAAGAALQDEIVALCRIADIPLIGPNSLGFFNVAERLSLTFSTVLDITWPRQGNIAIVSQSGAFGSYCYGLAAERGLGISHFAATGNEADVDVAEIIAWLADEPMTKVIMVYLEGCKNGPALRAALAKAAARGKPVVVMKAGATEAGAKAAASHTGAIAGADATFDAIFAEAGALRANSVQEFIDLAHAASVGPQISGRRLGVISVSGGMGVLIADAATASGLDLVQPGPQAAGEIREVVPFANPANPLDVTGQAGNDWGIFGRLLDIMVVHCEFDGLVVFLQHLGRNPEIFDRIEPSLIALRRNHPELAIVVSMGCDKAVRDRFLDAGILIFEDPVTATRILSRLAAAGDQRRSTSERTMPALVAASSLPPRSYNEIDALDLLKQAGMPVVNSRIAAGKANAVVHADTIGYPVVLKVLSADIAHKSDIGGVRLNLGSPAAVADGWQAIMDSVAREAPGARIDGVLVSPMVQQGVEVVLGARYDPVFGPMIIFGLGGTMVEIMKDVVIRPAPVDRDAAMAMVRGIRALPLLTGARGQPPVDLDAIADALMALSRFAVAHGEDVDSVEVNPFIVWPEGGVAVDALIIPRVS